MAVAEIVPRLAAVLRCPVCGGPVEAGQGSLRCPNRHTFDIARQGYVNLLSAAGGAHQADTAAMVQARAEFLDAGHYRELAGAVAGLAASVPLPPGAVVLDAGAGTGHYLAAVLDRQSDAYGLAVDASKYALRRAARAHPHALAVGWDVWRPLPIRSGAVELVLNVFAPRNAAEFHRVLAPGGALIVVTPDTAHLEELVEVLELLAVDARKEERLDRALADHFRLEQEEHLRISLTLDAAAVRRLVDMGPSAWHVDAAGLEARIAALDLPVRVTASFGLRRYRALPPLVPAPLEQGR